VPVSAGYFTTHPRWHKAIWSHVVNESGKRFSRLFAALITTARTEAVLLRFRRVDTLEPDNFVSDLDSVAINHGVNSATYEILARFRRDLDGRGR
jgi:hypothetical protein